MKKTLWLTIILILLLALSACSPGTATSASTTTAVPETSSTTESSSPATEPETTAAPTTSLTSIEASAAETTPASSVTGVSPTNTVEMYSSYAHMVSYDPARGWADFDYFSMLRGDEAVDWLVEHEGYTRDDAQAMVNDFADSEFIEKNTNLQLRTIDLRSVALKLMYYPDGTMVSGAEPVVSTLNDLYDLYHLNPALVTDSFFYYITVVNGEVTVVEQVYWP